MRAIIYTHSHPAHTGGASVFAGNDALDIHGHEQFLKTPADVGCAGREGGDQFGMAVDPRVTPTVQVRQLSDVGLDTCEISKYRTS